MSKRMLPKVEFPCKDCITLVMCRNLLEDYYRKKKYISHATILFRLIEKCSLMKDYVDYNRFLQIEKKLEGYKRIEEFFLGEFMESNVIDYILGES